MCVPATLPARACVQRPALFANQAFYVLEPLDKMSALEMRFMLTIAGASVLPDESSIADVGGPVTVLTCLSKCTPRRMDGVRAKHAGRVHIVDQAWALDSISQYRILPTAAPTRTGASARKSSAPRFA